MWILRRQRDLVRQKALAVRRDRAMLARARRQWTARIRHLLGSPLGLSAAFAAGLTFGWSQGGAGEPTPSGRDGEGGMSARRSSRGRRLSRAAVSGLMLLRRLQLF